MVNLTLRNIPEELLKKVRIFAARERRSLNSEMLMIVEEGVNHRISEGTANAGGQNNSATMSGLARDKLWTELCGSWQGSESIQDLIAAVYVQRSGDKQI